MTAALVVGGYVASQLATWRGEQVDFAKRIDQPPIAMLAGVLFLGLLIVGLLPGKES